MCSKQARSSSFSLSSYFSNTKNVCSNQAETSFFGSFSYFSNTTNVKLLIFRCWKFLRKYQIFFKLVTRKLHFLNYKKRFKSEFFLFSPNSESYFPKYKKFPEMQESFVSWNRNFFFGISVSRNIRKAFFKKKFPNIRARKFQFPKYE